MPYVRCYSHARIISESVKHSNLLLRGISWGGGWVIGTPDHPPVPVYRYR